MQIHMDKPNYKMKNNENVFLIMSHFQANGYLKLISE